MKNLTSKQQEFFEKIKEKYGNNYLPSFESIAKDFNFKHKNSAFQYIKRFRALGLVEENNNRFKIKDEHFGARMFSSYVRAGFASAIEDDIESRISLDYELDINAPSTFVFKVAGDSMVDLGIFEGDLVIIKKCSEAKDGEVVLANLDGGLTLKIFKNEGGRSFLRPANKNYPDMYPEFSLSIFGKASGIVRKFD